MSFECKGPVHLRVTDANTRRECLGPYDLVKVVRGAISTQDTWLGAYAAMGLSTPQPICGAKSCFCSTSEFSRVCVAL